MNLKREELVALVKLCGEAISENADSIVSNFALDAGLTVSFTLEKDSIPSIDVYRNFFPRVGDCMQYITGYNVEDRPSVCS